MRTYLHFGSNIEHIKKKENSPEEMLKRQHMISKTSIDNLGSRVKQGAGLGPGGDNAGGPRDKAG